jgi:hypothetical protein
MAALVSTCKLRNTLQNVLLRGSLSKRFVRKKIKTLLRLKVGDKGGEVF